jgi:hypothetical protein
MKVSIIVFLSDGYIMETPIFVIVYKTRKAVINALLNNKIIANLMGTHSSYSNDDIRKNIESVLNGQEYSCTDNETYVCSLKCITQNVERHILFEDSSKDLHCIFELKLDRDTDTICDINFELIRLYHIEQYDDRYNEFSDIKRYDKNGWWYYVRNDITMYYKSSFINIKNDKYRYAKMISRNEITICDDEQRDIDFIERVNYVLIM